MSKCYGIYTTFIYTYIYIYELIAGSPVCYRNNDKPRINHERSLDIKMHTIRLITYVLVQNCQPHSGAGFGGSGYSTRYLLYAQQGALSGLLIFVQTVLQSLLSGWGGFPCNHWLHKVTFSPGTAASFHFSTQFMNLLCSFRETAL